MSKKTTSIIAGMAALMMTSATAFAGGFQLYSSTAPEVLGVAGAVSARSDIVANAFFNPAALAFNERNGAIQVNAGVVALHSERRSAVTDSFSTESDKLVALGSLAYFQKLNDRLTFSFGINAPYGMETHWSEQNYTTIIPTTPAPTPVPGSVDLELATLYFSPSLTYKITDNFAISAGIDLVYGWATIHKGHAVPTVGSLHAEADGFGLGAHVAAYWNINEYWSVGVKYQSEVKIDFEGDAHTKGAMGTEYTNGANADLPIRLPQSVSFGVANRYFDNWVLSAEVVWTDWSCFQALDADIGQGRYHEKKHWKPAMSYRLGAEYMINENWKLRFGYCYDNSPIPKHTLESGIPGANYHELAFGVGYSQNNWSIDAGYGILLFDSIDSDNINDLYSEYHKTMIHVLQFGYTYRW